MTTHPAWCSPRYCDATDPTIPVDGGEHRSQPIALDLRLVMTRRGSLSANGTGLAYLTRAARPWTTAAYLHLQTDGDDVTLPLAQAAGVLSQLTALAATGDMP